MEERKMADDPIRPSREEATGTARDEATATLLHNQQEAWFANVKRTFDEFQKISLEHSQNSQGLFQQAAANLQGQLAQLNAVTLQAIQNSVNVTNQAHQNAIETSNMVGKQTIRHADIAIDGQWNPVQQGAGDTLTAKSVTLDDASIKAIGAAAAAIAASMATGRPPVNTGGA